MVEEQTKEFDHLLFYLWPEGGQLTKPLCDGLVVEALNVVSIRTHASAKHTSDIGLIVALGLFGVHPISLECCSPVADRFPTVPLPRTAKAKAAVAKPRTAGKPSRSEAQNRRPRPNSSVTGQRKPRPEVRPAGVQEGARDNGLKPDLNYFASS